MDKTLVGQTVTGNFCTSVYGVTAQGTFSITLPIPLPVKFTTQITLVYTAKYRSGQIKKFDLECIYSSALNRIIGQTKLDFVQMFGITLVFGQPHIYGFYSSLYPADCGVLETTRPTDDSSFDLNTF